MRSAHLRIGLLVVATSILASPELSSAQYFGRNKVQYDRFEFRRMDTPHFRIHFYPSQSEAMVDVSRMAERWYERLARIFQHELSSRKPLIFYANHPDFQQTNVISGQIGEGVGGVTEGFKHRVIMPLGTSMASTDHVLGHELVHSFQYDIAEGRRGGGLQNLMRLPLWMVEGMAEYLSVGREYPLTGMWLRDAIRRDDFPTLRQMSRERRFFPYRFGHAFFNYVGKTHGDEAVTAIYRSALERGGERAIEEVLGSGTDSVSARWRRAVEEHYEPLMEGRTPPREAGTLLLAPETGAGEQNVAPAVSPDGRYVAFMSERDLFSIDLFLADARSGRIIRKIASADADAHADALRFIDSAGAWSPDSRRFAYVVFAGGRNQIVIRDVERGRVDRRIRVPPEIGEIANPTWSPDGAVIVFSGHAEGFTDLYEVALGSGELTRLTDDRFADLHPSFSPDGRFIAFASDRGEETDLGRLTYSETRISIYDRDSGEIDVLELFGDVQHSNPQYAPDGQSIYFLSDQDGFQDIYRVDLETDAIHRVTTLATAVSGITGLSPAMSVARDAGNMVFSVFDELQFHVYSLDLQEVADRSAASRSRPAPGRLLPPEAGTVRSRVQSYLANPTTGLVERGFYSPEEDSEAYRASLSLDHIGMPTIGIGIDQTGTYLGGSVSGFFSDMLGNHVVSGGLQAHGELQDVGGQVAYLNRERRWNWGAGVARSPLRFLQSRRFRDAETDNVILLQDQVRQFNHEVIGMAEYPFSTARRAEFSVGVQRYSWSVEQDSLVLDPSGRRVLASASRERTDLEPEPLFLQQGSAALVGDNSVSGFTSPVRGSRWRAEVQQVMGALNYTTLLGDYRRYFNPRTELTIAFRGLHTGRYGGDLRGSAIRPIFLGTETLVRGYSFESFEPDECTLGGGTSRCPALDRLFGQRIGVVNAEIRMPLFGVDRFGLFSFAYLPTELVLFTDAGVAWSAGDGATLTFDRTTVERVPVFSSGVSARVNILGMMILEIYYAQPWQRPDKGAHFGFELAPGW